jgi:hypothetical protein
MVIADALHREWARRPFAAPARARMLVRLTSSSSRPEVRPIFIGQKVDWAGRRFAPSSDERREMVRAKSRKRAVRAVARA